MPRAQRVFAIIGIVAIFGLMQFARPPRNNPRTVASQTIFAQTSMPAGVKSYLGSVCRDCHSHDTVWRFYSNFAPVLWLQAADVWAGRFQMDLSRWGAFTTAQKEDRLKGICNQVREGKMPLSYYKPLHPDTWHLSKTLVDHLCEWTEAERKKLGGMAEEEGFEPPSESPH
jgi:hypothetical protein